MSFLVLFMIFLYSSYEDYGQQQKTQIQLELVNVCVFITNMKTRWMDIVTTGKILHYTQETLGTEEPHDILPGNLLHWFLQGRFLKLLNFNEDHP